MAHQAADGIAPGFGDTPRYVRGLLAALRKVRDETRERAAAWCDGKVRECNEAWLSLRNETIALRDAGKDYEVSMQAEHVSSIRGHTFEDVAAAIRSGEASKGEKT